MSERGNAALSFASLLYLTALAWLLMWVAIPAVLLGWHPAVVTTEAASTRLHFGDVVLLDEVADAEDPTAASPADVPRDGAVGRLLVPLAGLPVAWAGRGDVLLLGAWLALTAGAGWSVTRARAPHPAAQAPGARWSKPVEGRRSGTDRHALEAQVEGRSGSGLSDGAPVDEELDEHARRPLELPTGAPEAAREAAPAPLVKVGAGAGAGQGWSVSLDDAHRSLTGTDGRGAA